MPSHTGVAHNSNYRDRACRYRISRILFIFLLQHPPSGVTTPLRAHDAVAGFPLAHGSSRETRLLASILQRGPAFKLDGVMVGRWRVCVASTEEGRPDGEPAPATSYAHSRVAQHSRFADVLMALKPSAASYTFQVAVSTPGAVVLLLDGRCCAHGEWKVSRGSRAERGR